LERTRARLCNEAGLLNLIEMATGKLLTENKDALRIGVVLVQICVQISGIDGDRAVDGVGSFGQVHKTSVEFAECTAHFMV